LGPCGAACKWQQGDVARTLDGHAQPALVPGANSGHAPRKNLAALLDELREDVCALIVDKVHLLNAELADLLLAEILAFAARTAAGPARTTAARSAFAARTTMPASGPTMAARTAFAARRSTVRLCLFGFLCHTILPFSLLEEFNFSLLALIVQEPEREPEPGPKRAHYGVDAARHAVRAFRRASFGASNLRQGARSNT
jgi:hypothetical protein